MSPKGVQSGLSDGPRLSSSNADAFPIAKDPLKAVAAPLQDRYFHDAGVRKFHRPAYKATFIFVCPVADVAAQQFNEAAAKFKLG
jgi:hypothetical protein